MNDEENKDFTESGPKDIIDEESAHWSRIENALQDLRPGYSVAVHRMKPSWAKGYLERIELLEGDTIDFDYLRDTWGGEVLRLRICDQNGTYKRAVDLPFMSWPPRKHGKILKRYDANDDDEKKHDRDRAYVQPIPAQAPQTSSETLGQIMQLLKQTRSEDLRTFKEILSQIPTEPPVVGNTLENFITMAHQVKELKGLFGEAEKAMSPSAGDDQTALFQTIAEVIKSVSNNRQPAQQSAPRLVQYAPNRPGPMPPGSAQPLPRSAPVNIPQQLAEMDEQEAAANFISALARMKPGKREKTVQAIFSGLGVEDDLSFNDDDIDDQDDDEADRDDSEN